MSQSFTDSHLVLHLFFLSLDDTFYSPLHFTCSLTNLLLIPLFHLFTSAGFFPLLSLLSTCCSSWSCDYGFCSFLSLTLPFTPVLPVLLLHAASRGRSSVGAHSQLGASELREANLHPGKPLCELACLRLSGWISLSHIVDLFSDFSPDFSPFITLFCFSLSCWSRLLFLLSIQHIHSLLLLLCSSFFALLSFLASPRSDVSLSIMTSNYSEVHSF